MSSDYIMQWKKLSCNLMCNVIKSVVTVCHTFSDYIGLTGNVVSSNYWHEMSCHLITLYTRPEMPCNLVTLCTDRKCHAIWMLYFDRKCHSIWYVDLTGKYHLITSCHLITLSCTDKNVLLQLCELHPVLPYWIKVPRWSSSNVLWPESWKTSAESHRAEPPTTDRYQIHGNKLPSDRNKQYPCCNKSGSPIQGWKQCLLSQGMHSRMNPVSIDLEIPKWWAWHGMYFTDIPHEKMTKKSNYKLRDVMDSVYPLFP